MKAREARHLARCVVCRVEGPRLGAAIRALPAPSLTLRERERLWVDISEALDMRARWRPDALLRWFRGLRRRRPALVWVPAAAVAAMLVIAPLHFGREERVVSQATLNAQTVIERVEVGRASSVLVLETPTSRVQVIWVVEPGDSPEGTR